MKKKNIVLLFLLIFTLIFTTGCTSQNFSIYATREETVSFKAKIALNKDYYALLDSYNVDTENSYIYDESSDDPIDRCNPLFQEYASVLYNYGFEIQPINDNVEIGFMAEKKYDTFKEFNEDMENLSKNTIFKLDIKFGTSKSIIQKNYFAKGTFTYMIDPDMPDINDIDVNIKEMYNTSSIYATLQINFPGNVMATNGKNVSGIPTWTVDFDGEPVEISLQTGEKNNAILLLFGGIIIFAVLAVIAFISKKNKMKKERKETNFLRTKNK